MNPYGESFDLYWRAGWRGILPLPYGRKTYPPDGHTGYGGTDPSYADCATWATDGQRNVCLRMPDGVVGLDVDHYDGKVGGDTLARLVDQYGPLPATWMSTSRDDGISGIRLYRVPEGVVLPTKLPGIELVQRHHRYAVVWPSVHPEGRTYRWIDERTGLVDGVPSLADIPALPAAWVDGLAVEASQASKSDVGEEDVVRILTLMPAGEPCEHMLRHAGKALAGGDRHDSYNEAVLAVVGAGRRGCPGVMTVIPRLRAAFLSEVTAAGPSQRTVGEAHAEWRRSLHGAVAIVADEVQGTVCPDDVFQWLEDITAPEGDGQAEPVEPSPYDRLVARRAVELRVTEDAKALLAAERAAAAPPLAGVTLSDFLAQPDEDERYRVEGLWPAEGRVLLPAPAKAGKTTLVIGNLIPALVDGGPFLGRFPVTPVTRRVVLFNLEVGERTLRGWARRAGVSGSDRVTVVNLRGRVGALGLGSAAGRARLSAFLRDQDAEVVILDPLAPALASLGLDENANADVASFFSWWSEALAEAGVTDDLICHHIGHGGDRSRGASRLLDEPDAIWTLTRQRVEEEDGEEVYGPAEQRFLQAYGRDVDQPLAGLRFDPFTGRLTLVDGGPEQHRKERRQQAVLAVVAAQPGIGKAALMAAIGGKAPATKALIDDMVRDPGCPLEMTFRGQSHAYFLATVSPISPDFPPAGKSADPDRFPFPSYKGNGSGATGNDHQDPLPGATVSPEGKR